MNDIQTTSLESFARLPLGRLQKDLHALYRQHGPLTDKEAARLLQLAPSTVSGIRNPMVKRGSVERTNERRNGGYLWRIRPLPEAREGVQTKLFNPETKVA